MPINKNSPEFLRWESLMVREKKRLHQVESFRDIVVLVLREYTEALLVAITLALVLRFFVVASYRIPTQAMAPTLQMGDFIFAYKLPYGEHWNWLNPSGERGKMPELGDVVIFECPKKPHLNCAKRVVGLPGDRVQLIKKRLFVNGKAAIYSETNAALEEPTGIQGPHAVINERLGMRQYSIVVSAALENGAFGPLVLS